MHALASKGTREGEFGDTDAGLRSPRRPMAAGRMAAGLRTARGCNQRGPIRCFAGLGIVRLKSRMTRAVSFACDTPVRCARTNANVSIVQGLFIPVRRPVCVIRDLPADLPNRRAQLADWAFAFQFRTRFTPAMRPCRKPSAFVGADNTRLWCWTQPLSMNQRLGRPGLSTSTSRRFYLAPPRRQVRSWLAIRAGTWKAPLHTSASFAMPSRILAAGGFA